MVLPVHGADAEHGDGRQRDDARAQDVHIGMHFIIISLLHLFCTVLSNKQTEKQARHIGKRKASGDQEHPLQPLEQENGFARVLQFLHHFDDAFVQQRLGDIAARTGHAGDRKRADGEIEA